MKMYKYFDFRDFDNCTPKCNINQMNEDFMIKLDCAREIAGIPFVLNSAYRTVEWEKAKGRSGTSSHTIGCAADIKCNNSSDRLKIVSALIEIGFKRIGIYNSFIHVDNDPYKTDCIFLG